MSKTFDNCVLSGDVRRSLSFLDFVALLKLAGALYELRIGLRRYPGPFGIDSFVYFSVRSVVIVRSSNLDIPVR